MSKLAATQIPKPADEQAFERASVVVWRCLLGDPNIQRNGRRGQRQNGVDLFGYRDRDPARLVGIQCKLKGDGQFLTEGEIRDELRKALTFKPALQEYFIVTTAPDDVAMQELARELVIEQAKLGRMLMVYVWGWNTLEEHISEYRDALRAFDPTYGVFGAELLDAALDIKLLQARISVDLNDGLSSVNRRLERIEATLIMSPGDTTTAPGRDDQLDAEIDTLRDLITAGKPRTALEPLEKLLVRVGAKAPGRILFRIKANIASCHIALGDREKGTSLLLEAYAHAPDEPKAVANKAYALLLRDEWRELAAFSADALTADPANEILAGYLVQATRYDLSIDDPLALVPEGLRRSLAVTVAHVFFLRHRGSDTAWREAARQARDAYPEDENAQQFAADADLDEIIQDPRFQRTHLLTPEQKLRLVATIGVLTEIWDRTRQTEGVVPSDALGPCVNLILAHHVNQDLPKALEIARQGLAVAPDDGAVLMRAAAVAVEVKDDTFAAELLERVPPGADATLLAFQFHARRGDWEKLMRFVDTQPGDVPESEYVVVRTTARLAELRLSADDPADRLGAVIDEVADNPRASVVASAFARMRGLDDLALQAFENAVSGIMGDTHFADRLMTAMEAATRYDWPRVTDLLDGHIAEDHDSEELRTLATAYINASPIRRQALRFYERLPTDVAELPFYVQCAGLFHFNRGALKQAEASLRKAVDASPNVENCLALCATLKRTGREAEVLAFLERIGIESLKGTPAQKMLLAQALRESGFGKRAMAYGYDVLRNAPNDADVALRYLGMLLFGDADDLIPEVHEVGTGVWVRLENHDGKSFPFLIEEGEDRPGERVLSPRHPTAAMAMRRKVGDTFVQESPIGEDVTWRVAEVKHKYLYALHEVMEHFETRFPDAQGLYSMTIREGDVQPALDQMRRIAESNRTMADLYLQKHIPLSMVAELLGGDSTGFADYLRSLGGTVTACSGTHPERAAAHDTLEKRRGAGAVLDTNASWVAASMNAFDVLKGVFGTLVVPQAALDELREKKGRDELLKAGSMTVGWHDGKYVSQEHTEESIERRVSYIGEQIEKIEQHCSVIPVEVPDDPSDLAKLVMSRFDTHVLDAAYLAAGGFVLLSDDLHYRDLAVAATGAASGVWLQPVLAFARDSGLLTMERYADMVVHLAARRHGHLSLDAATLSQIVLDDGTPSLARFEAAADFIGTADADLASHLAVVLGFLVRLWDDDTVAEARKRAATGILLERLVRHRPDQWAGILAFLRMDAENTLREYIGEWIRGHFLAEGEVSAQERTVWARRFIRRARQRSAHGWRVMLASSWPIGH